MDRIIFHRNQNYFYNRYLQYIGDISYSLYLYHWPTLLFMKYHFIVESTTTKNNEPSSINHRLTFAVFIISCCFAIVSYYCIEKYFLSSTVGYTKTYAMIVLSYALLISLFIDMKYLPDYQQQFTNRIHQSNATKLTKAQILQINENHIRKVGFPWLNQCADLRRPTLVDKLGVECRTHYYLSCLNNDTIKQSSRNAGHVLVLGDSHAHRHYYAIRAALQSFNYEGVHVFSQSGCLPIITEAIVDADNGIDCPLFRKCLQRLVQEMRPNYLFHFSKYTQHVSRYLGRHTNEQVGVIFSYVNISMIMLFFLQRKNLDHQYNV